MSICIPSHEIMTTPYKSNQNKLRNLIFNKPNIKGWICKKTKKKNNPGQLGLANQTHASSHEIKITQ
jgi:hypothetical protein